MWFLAYFCRFSWSWYYKSGNKVDGQKIEAVMTWPRPLNQTEVHSFLGSAKYYHMFEERFFFISAPMKKSTHEGTEFQWTEACNQSFQEFKKKLTTTPILTLPKGNECFVVCGTSRIGLGCVFICLYTVKKGWKKLSYIQSRVDRSCLCSINLAALFIWGSYRYFHQSLESSILT